jgi:hypothetical protein
MREQLTDPALRPPAGEADQHVLQPSGRVDAGEVAAPHQRVQHRRATRGGVGPGEEVVPPPDRKRADLSLDLGVVQLEPTVVQEACQRRLMLSSA